MKLHLPNGLRKLVLTGGIIAIAATTPALAWQWDPIWFEQGSNNGPAPSKVKEYTNWYMHVGYWSDPILSQYRSEDENGKAFVAISLKDNKATNGSWIGSINHYGDGDVKSCTEVIGDTWLNLESGDYTYVSGGHTDTVGPDTYRYHGDIGQIGQIGDVHIRVGESARIYFGPSTLTYLVGGHYGVPTKDLRSDKIDFTYFKGSTYLSVYTDTVGSIAGGNGITDYRKNKIQEGDKFSNHVEVLFEGSSHVNIYNVLRVSMAYELTEDGVYIPATKWNISWDRMKNDEKDDIKNYYSFILSKSVSDFVCGGNYAQLTGVNGIHKFDGDSYITINLSGKSGQFGKRIYGGDYAVRSHINNYLHEGDTYVTITGAKGVTFMERVVGGSASWEGAASCILNGSTHVTIDSGSYQHFVIGGMNSGEIMAHDPTSAGRFLLSGNTNVKITGGTYVGHAYAFADTLKDEDEGKTIGAVSVVGGNGVFGNIESYAINELDGKTNTNIEAGDFQGHVVGSSALVGETEDASTIAVHVTGSSTLNMSGGKITEKSARVVGGMLVHTTQSVLAPSDLAYTDGARKGWEEFRTHWQHAAHMRSGYMETLHDQYDGMLESEHGVTLGDAEVTIYGAAENISGPTEVYDVVGGSWVASSELPGGVVKQGDIKVTLGAGVKVKGNVYAAGIQAGDVPITTKSTEVNIEKGVRFTATSSAPAVVSGGYLCADAQETEQSADAWKSWRDNASTVTGKRTLAFTSEGETYGSSDLEGVYFTNFDEVKVAAKDVKISALLLTDAQSSKEVNVTGGGMLSIVPTEITINGFKKQENGVKETSQTLLNLTAVSMNATSLHLLANDEKISNYCVQKVNMTGNSVLHVDAAPATGHSSVRVMDSITIGCDAMLRMSANLTLDMNDAANAILRKASSHSTEPTVSFTDGSRFQLELRKVEDSLKQKDELRVVLIDRVEGAFSVTPLTKEELNRAFGSAFSYEEKFVDSATWDDEHVWLGVEDGAMVLRGKVKKEQAPTDPDDTPTPIPPVLEPVPVEPEPTPIPPVLEPVPVDPKPTPIPPVEEPVPTPDEPTPIPPVLEPVPVDPKPTPIPPVLEPVPTPEPTPTLAETDYHRRNSRTPNGSAGGSLMDEYFDHTTGEDKGDVREKLLDRIIELNAAKQHDASDRLQAAVAGSSISVLALAAADDVERQMRLMRNRSGKSLTQELTRMRQRQVDGGKAGIRIHEYPEAVPAKKLTLWLNAEGEYNSMQERSTDPGFRLNSWGGTVGAAATLSRNIEAGLAITAMYGDLQSKGPDNLKGDMDTSYLSTFVRVESGKWTHAFIATVGLVDMDGTRSVNIGGEYGGYTTHYDTEGYALGLMYEAAYTVAGNRDKTSLYQAVANIAWRHVSLDGFTETGDTAAKLRAGDQKVDSLILGLGGRAQWLVGGDMLNRGSVLELRLLGKGYTGDLRNRVDVGFADRDHSAKVRSRKQGALGAEIGAGFTLPLDSGTGSYEHSLFIEVNYELRRACGDMNATLGYKLGF